MFSGFFVSIRAVDKTVQVSEKEVKVSLKARDQFIQESISEIAIGNPIKGIKATIGKLKVDGTSAVAEYAFEKSKWTSDEAVKWVEDHEGVRLDRNFTFASVKGVDEEKGRATFYASKAVVDRDGEILAADAFNNRYLERYKKNNVVLWAHDYHSMFSSTPKIVGSGENLTFDAEGMKFDTVFQRVTQFGKDVWELVRGGFLKAVSVGFIPKAWREATREEIEKAGANVRRVIVEAELLEVSIVPVPSNYEAVMTLAAKQFGAAKDETVPDHWLRILKEVAQAPVDGILRQGHLDDLKKDIEGLTGKIESDNIKHELAALTAKLDRIVAAQ